jgi:hypothetical protein
MEEEIGNSELVKFLDDNKIEKTQNHRQNAHTGHKQSAMFWGEA